MKGLAIALGIAAFVALLVWSAMREGKVECELCVTYQGRSACRAAKAADRKDAVQAATTAACAAIASGVTDTVQCQATAPTRLSCK